MQSFEKTEDEKTRCAAPSHPVPSFRAILNRVTEIYSLNASMKKTERLR